MWTLVTAISKNYIIGVDGKLPWTLKDDLKNFSKITKGHTVVMGRRTYESIGKALPNRRNIVLSSNKNWHAPDIEIWKFESFPFDATNLKNYLGLDKEIYIIGGAFVYQQLLPYCDRAIVTEVDIEIDIKDNENRYTLFNEYRSISHTWSRSILINQDADDRNEYPFQIVDLKRINNF